MRVANPYADLRALLDTTRQLAPEEVAELHLEQGFVDRALAIYEYLSEKEPRNAVYAMRREWLARMVRARPIRTIGTAPLEEEQSVDTTLRGVAAIPRDRSEGFKRTDSVRPLPIVRVR